MQHLFHHLKSFYHISTEAQHALEACFEEHTFYKGELLLKEGQVCRRLYFMQQGALRGFYNVEGKEITHWFAFENSFITSLHSFITQQPSVENIQLLENSQLWSISKANLDKLLQTHHDIERLLRIIYERYYIQLEERYVNAQFKSAAERYEQLLQQSPHIIERVSLGQIASYLGISQETLSRVRARL